MVEDFLRALSKPINLLLWIVFSVWTTLSGPFGTYETATLGERATHWPLIAGLFVVVAVAVRVAAGRYLAHFNPWQTAVFIASVLAALLSVPTFLMASAMLPPEVTPPTLDGVLIAAASVLSISLGLRALYHVVPVARPVATASPPPLMLRLPSQKQAPLIRLTSSDHYVRVVTERGETDLLMRFADAISELGEVEGARVHRSHWVARSAVEGVRRDSGRVMIRTRDGAEVPVSRTYQRVLDDWNL
ncbi:hypothetical protein RGUI_3786 [Rhodovulum sp. P5]|uniref:LytTR family DNA-binding domain-containing protein n=1 Tax=Rhodovulum sp. P5 TaxID=1564506 RepID=UPI0009C1B66E|nr:LytTR family DNA-binding domain-containing protein [Rhodovulum sp. P5]ARE41927.1 hypothetical protein RGUI_3786 [Rhodovulum sp. P5]